MLTSWGPEHSTEWCILLQFEPEGHSYSWCCRRSCENVCCFVHLWWVTVGCGVCSNALCKCVPAGTPLCGSHSSHVKETKAHTESSWWAPVHCKKAKHGSNVTEGGTSAHRWLRVIEGCSLYTALTETQIPLILKEYFRNIKGNVGILLQIARAAIHSIFSKARLFFPSLCILLLNNTFRRSMFLS